MLVFAKEENQRTQRKTLDTWRESRTMNSIQILVSHEARLVGGEDSHHYTILLPKDFH